LISQKTKVPVDLIAVLVAPEVILVLAEVMLVVVKT
jgi:hypothetical protein